jgi:hypothetical protein
MSTIDGGGDQMKETGKTVSEFDGRVATMHRDGRDCGYLFVTAEDVEAGPPAFTMEFLRAAGENTWYYSDRTDPDDYDTAAELAGAEIDWYGTSYSARWLPEADASAIKALFYSEDRPKRRLFRGSGAAGEGRPRVITDPGT